MKRLIINADDFGLSPGVNRGIVSAFRDGVLTSTTMLVNLGAFADATRLAREHPELPVGIHLSLLWGRPVSPPAEVPSLVDRDGRFPDTLGRLGARYLLGRLSREQVTLEFRNQVRAFLETGLRPTHVDTHKHIHCLSGILDCLISAVGEFGIDRVRLPREEPSGRFSRAGAAAPSRGSWTANLKRQLIRFLCRGGAARLRRAGIHTTDRFVGIGQTGSLNSEVLNLILCNLGDGTTEVMCHPGYDDEEARQYSSMLAHREVELAALRDPRIRECIDSREIRLINYGEL